MNLKTIDEAAEQLRVPVSTLRYWRATGKGGTPVFVRIGRRLVVRQDDLDRFVAQQFADAQSKTTSNV